MLSYNLMLRLGAKIEGHTSAVKAEKKLLTLEELRKTSQRRGHFEEDLEGCVGVFKLMRKSMDNTYSIIMFNNYLLVTYKVPVIRLCSGYVAINKTEKSFLSLKCFVSYYFL